MTTIAIIGGHGQVALLATRELTSGGHEVRSVIRNPEHLADIEEAGATGLVIDIETATAFQLVSGLGDVDTIIFAAGAGPGSGPARKETVDHQGAVKALEAATVIGARLLVISFIGADEQATGEEQWVAYQQAKKAADDAVRASDIDWTIVRPGHLTDEPRTGLVTIADDATGSTSRANTAALLALLATSHPAPQRVLSVIDGETPLELAIS